MKYIILFAFLLCSCVVYAQDLIVTTTGDSLKCKIIEVDADKMQFRFGTGNVISIKRSEVSSYKYNFEPASGKPSTTGSATNRTVSVRPADPVDDNTRTGTQPETTPKTIQPVLFDEKGGKNTVTITDLSNNWKVIGNPEWCAVTRKGNVLTVTCAENPATTDRKNEIVITDNARRVVIPIEQAAKSCYEAGISESKDLYRKAQAMQTVGNKDEAARLFFAAFKKIQDTKNNCSASANQVSANQESGTLTDKIRKDIEVVGYTIKDNELVKQEDRKTSAPSEQSPRFYAAATAGAATFGTCSFGKIENGGAAVFGADVAYFFNRNFGAGLKLSVETCDVDLSGSESTQLTWSDRVMFVGPALYIRLGKGKVAFTACAGVGALSWKMSEIVFRSDDLYDSADDVSATAVGGFVSAGVNYMFTQHFGLGLNVQSTFGSVKADDDLKRNPAGIGAGLGLIFRF